jgi:hypothetical protein
MLLINFELILCKSKPYMKKITNSTINTALLITIQFLMLFTVQNSYSQTITERPIYKSCSLCPFLTIEKKDNGIVFFYQDSRYSSIISIESFALETLQDAILLMEKVLFVLNMPKTMKDENIIDEYKGVNISRLGVAQIVAYVGKEERFVINKNTTIKVITALKEYEKKINNE